MAAYTSATNPVVYFDMTVGGLVAGRIEMTLRADVVHGDLQLEVQTRVPASPPTI